MDPSKYSKEKDNINDIKTTLIPMYFNLELLLDKFYNFKLRKRKHYLCMPPQKRVQNFSNSS